MQLTITPKPHQAGEGVGHCYLVWLGAELFLQRSAILPLQESES